MQGQYSIIVQIGVGRRDIGNFKAKEGTLLVLNDA
jgi:hypothetical protein